MLEGSVSISDNSRGRHPPHGLCEQLCWSRELGGGEIQQVGLWGLSPSDAHVGLPALPIPSLACPRRGQEVTKRHLYIQADVPFTSVLL